MESAHQVINTNMHLEEIAYNATLRHPAAIQSLKDLPPHIVGKAFEALISPERTQVIWLEIVAVTNRRQICFNTTREIWKPLVSNWFSYGEMAISDLGVFMHVSVNVAWHYQHIKKNFSGDLCL